MKAVILSAGQGRRLLPLTRRVPKCVLPVGGKPILQWQIETLRKAGVTEIVVVLGHGAEKAEAVIRDAAPDGHVRVLYNPFHAVADNLASCWLAAGEMDEDFILLNGDTLCEPSAVATLLRAPRKAITVTIDEKDTYDNDDMRVRKDGNKLLNIGKHLLTDETHAESIGMLLFRGDGPARFRWALERSMRKAKGLKQWYLSVIDELAQTTLVSTCSIKGMRWAEVDTEEDLHEAAVIMSAVTPARKPAPRVKRASASQS